MRKSVSLAKFPSENPNPVLRLSGAGIVLYANAASDALLSMWGCAVGEATPPFWSDLAAEVLARRESKTVEIECDGKIYSMIFNPVAEPAYVNLYGRNITARKQAEEELKTSNEELSMLFELSHSLAEADNLEQILDLVNRHAAESIHATFARIALLQDGKYVMRAAYPIRILDLDLGIGDRYPVASLPATQRILEQNWPVVMRASDPGLSTEEKRGLLLDYAQSVCVIPLRSSDSSATLGRFTGLAHVGGSAQ